MCGNENSLHVYFEIPAAFLFLECSVPLHATLEWVLSVIRKMYAAELEGRFRLDENAVVIEKITETICPMDISFRAMGAWNGLILVIY